MTGMALVMPRHKASGVPDVAMIVTCLVLVTMRRKFGAGEGIRTLDPDLGKVVLYP